MSLATLYRALTLAAGPLAPFYLARRARRGKEEPARRGERFGEASLPRPTGPLVWVHAASLGEAASMLGLIDRLLDERPLAILFTTGTLTSARLLAEHARRDGRLVHQFVPLDHPSYASAFLDHWRPDLGLWVESELWPNLLGAARARGMPTLLVNARMSARSETRWLRLPGLIRPLLAGFDLCLAQDAAQAERLKRLGARQVRSVGDLKSSAPPLEVSAAELARLRRFVADRPLWLAASTHEGEEEIVADAHLLVKRTLPRILTVIVPRHPDRAPAIARMLEEKGLAVARRSAGESIARATDLYLADTLGELGLFYSLAGIAFIGGSLAPKGGHNPYEAARLDCAILHGPDMANTAAIAAALAAAGASKIVGDAETLARAVLQLLQHPEERDRRAAAALAVAQAQAGVLDAVMAQLQPWLDRLTAHAEPVPA
ncbi:MAG: 3-deoxy-D-manno-octulosonic acid transferase [Stellaceae bacterium]